MNNIIKKLIGIKKNNIILANPFVLLAYYSDSVLIIKPFYYL